MKLVLLCGGVGKRMFPIARGKSLLKFIGKPLILHQIDGAMKAGLSRFLIVANPENISELKSATTSIPDADIDFVVQKNLRA